MDETAARILGWFLSALAGGGIATAAGFALLKDRLRPFFATREDLDNLGGRVTGTLSVATMAKETADANAANIIRLQEADRHRWEPVAQVLERLDARLDRHEQAITRVTAILDEVSRRLDRQDGSRRA